MKNATLSYEQDFYVNGSGLSGVQSIDGSYGISEAPINILGYGFLDNTLTAPLEGQFTIQRVLINEDTLLNLTGDNRAFSGVVSYNTYGSSNTGSFGFHSGYLTSYSLSCDIGSLPTVSTDIAVYGDLGRGLLSASESAGAGSVSLADNSIDPPNQGTISITCDELKTSSNRIVSINHEINCARQAIYALPVSASDTKAKYPVQVDLMYPVEQTTNITLEIDDYQTKNIYDYLTGVYTGDVTIDINGNNGTDLVSFELENARLISESFSSAVDGSASVNMTFKKFINRKR
jgi:hypothetical protein